MRALNRGRRELGIVDGSDYEATALDYYWKNTSRPELHWRTFKCPTGFRRPAEQTFILHRK